MLERNYRPALGVFIVATLSGFAFAFLTGFSIGRFVALLPLVMTAFAVTQGRSGLSPRPSRSAGPSKGS